jgi:hypothetical protein
MNEVLLTFVVESKLMHSITNEAFVTTFTFYDNMIIFRIRFLWLSFIKSKGLIKVSYRPCKNVPTNCVAILAF